MKRGVAERCMFYEVCDCSGVCRYYSPVEEDDEWVVEYDEKYYRDFQEDWQVYLSEFHD